MNDNLRRRILDIAASQDGTTEDPPGSNNVLYWDWWANGDGVTEASEVLGAWCAAFVSWVFDQAGAPLPPVQRDRGGFAGVQAGVRWAVNAGEWTQDPSPGDIAMFSWTPVAWDDGYPWVQERGQWVTAGDHTGIFSHFDGENFWCWEGNTSVAGSQDNGGAVHLRPRPASVIIGFWRPSILDGPAPPMIGDATPEEEDNMLHAYRLADDPATIWVRDPATGKVRTVNSLTPAGAQPMDTYTELVASGMLRPAVDLGWNANWALAVIDGRV